MRTTMRTIRLIGGIFGLVAFGYAVWQAPFHGKWAEGAFWMALSISSEFGTRNLWGTDE
jgi:hypothetical protein